MLRNLGLRGWRLQGLGFRRLFGKVSHLLLATSLLSAFAQVQRTPWFLEHGIQEQLGFSEASRLSQPEDIEVRC